ncbi:MAG: glucokinase [Panacagrimonas sp.]
MILVGDVGGTNTRLATAQFVRDGWQLEALRVYPTPSDLASLVAEYCRTLGVIDLVGAALCGAGPRQADGRLKLTNRDTWLDPAALAAATGLKRVHVLNDFEAVAWCLPALGPADQRMLGSGTVDCTAPRLVLGAGTGLGVASLVPQGAQGYVVLPGEGGHTDLAPVDEVEHAAWTCLRRDLGRVTAEHVFSGPGLERLHAALHGGEALGAPAISAGLAAGEARATRTIAIFTRWIGRFAGNQALSLGARGGIYIAGGVIPSWGERFDARIFREGFEDKAPHVGWMQRVPAAVVTHPQPGLLGLAAFAAMASG